MFLVRCGHVLSAILKNIFSYLLNRHISLGAFVYRKWNIKSSSEMVWASLFTPSFFKACPDMIYADFPILQKGCHNIVNIVALLRCQNEWMNVAIMLWRCFLTMFCVNIVATFLKVSWICCGNLICQCFHNFPPTLWKRCCNHILLAG